jgi:hypothetical protein
MLAAMPPPSASICSMSFITSPTERTTAATDLLLAAMGTGYSIRLLRLRKHDRWQARLWAGAFAALGLGAGLGAVAHGLELTPRKKELVWQGIYPSLACAVALFATGACRDRWGEATARRALPVALASAGVFALLVRRLPGGFLAFLGYEALAMLFALAVYGDLARQQRRPGAPLMVGGIGLSILAAALQASKLQITLFGQPFDNNGIFHLVQMGGLPLLVAGLEAGIE